MITPCFDSNFFNIDHSYKSRRRDKKGGNIENQDGTIMFVAEAVAIEIEEEQMANKSYKHELLHALKISWPLLVIIIASVFAFFQLTQSRIDSQMVEVRAQMAADRKSASDDNAALRGDMTQGFNRLADKLDAITQRLDDKIDKSAEKTDSKLDKINESLNELRQAKPAK